VIRVFVYLAWCSARNRLVGQLQRLRSPRYLAALAIGIAYLWVITVEQRPRPEPTTSAAAPWLELLGAIGVAGAVAWGWVFGVERRVLSFTPAEVTFLFSGPVPRRGLIQYKLLRNQLLILFNSLLWTLILARERFGTSPWLRAFSIWVLLTTLSFHRLGASFVRTSLLEHGRFGLRHRVVSLVVLAAAVVTLAWSLRDASPLLAAGWNGGTTEFLAALARAAERPVLHGLLAPFTLMVRPLTAPTLSAWLASLGPALLLLVLHYVWVVRADTAFEEAAAEASMERAQQLGTRGAAARTPRLAHRQVPRLLPLAPTGWPAGAILWKNLLAVARMRRTRNAVMAFAGAVVVVALLSFDAEGTIASIAGWLAVMWGGMMIVIGPQWVRNDLRSDLLKLDLLRSYPLRGRAVVAAEAGGSALVLTAIQLALLVVAYFAFLGDVRVEPDLETRTLILAAAVVHLPGVNFAGMLIQNGTALLYPAWVHLGSGRPGGVEALGQNMLMIVAYLGLLGVTLAVPAGLGVGSYLLLAPALGLWAAVPASLLLLGALAAETTLLLGWLGRIFEGTDPATAGIAV
jgi:ABC-2 type transport system permease protein